MVKFQLYLRKLIIQAFKISVQVTIGIKGIFFKFIFNFLIF